MKTETRPAHVKSDTLALRNILVPLEFSSRADHAISKERMIDTTAEIMASRLGRHPFLAGMNQRQLAILAGCATAVQINGGQIIFREGDPANRLYLIETGKVNLESSGGPGDPMLGWAWMFPPYVWTYTARAVEPTTAIFFDGAVLKECCEKDHSFGYEFLKRMNLVIYQRMQSMRSKALAIQRRDLRRSAVAA